MDRFEIARIMRELTRRYREQTGEVFTYTSVTKIINNLMMLSSGTYDYESFKAEASKIEKEAAERILNSGMTPRNGAVFMAELERALGVVKAGEKREDHGLGINLDVQLDDEEEWLTFYKEFEAYKNILAMEFNIYMEICIAQGREFEHSGVCDIENGYFGFLAMMFCIAADLGVNEYNEAELAPGRAATFGEVLSSLECLIAAEKGISYIGSFNKELTDYLLGAMRTGMSTSGGDVHPALGKSIVDFMEIYQTETEMGYVAYIDGLGIQAAGTSPSEHLWKAKCFAFGAEKKKEKHRHSPKEKSGRKFLHKKDDSPA